MVDYAMANKGLALGPTFFGLFLDSLLLGVLLCEVFYWKIRLASSDKWQIHVLVVRLVYE